jgi:hypothetical protein
VTSRLAGAPTSELCPLVNPNHQFDEQFRAPFLALDLEKIS